MSGTGEVAAPPLRRSLYLVAPPGGDPGPPVVHALDLPGLGAGSAGLPGLRKTVTPVLKTPAEPLALAPHSGTGSHLHQRVAGGAGEAAWNSELYYYS